MLELEFSPEQIRIQDLKPHPRNYRQHPPDQLEHLMSSIRENGLYRNVVIAEDNTILAGHGVTMALERLGYVHVSVIRLPVAPDSPAALKVLAGDNEIDHLAVVDDRMLTEILKDLKEDSGLLGTGYDDMMLANLLFVTRPESEIETKDDAAEWVGMPEYEQPEKPHKLTISFRSAEDRARFVKKANVRIDKKEAKNWSTWWPFRERDDLRSVRLDPAEDQATSEEQAA